MPIKVSMDLAVSPRGLVVWRKSVSKARKGLPFQISLHRIMLFQTNHYSKSVCHRLIYVALEAHRI